MTTTQITQADNGYFQVWMCADGVERRVSTEDTGFARRNPAERKRLDAATKARLEAKFGGAR